MIKNSKIFILVLVSLIIIGISPSFADDFESQNTELVQPPTRGKVIEIISEEKLDNESLGENSTMTIQMIKVEITSGMHKGKVIEVQNLIDEMYAYNIYVDKGEKVLLYIENDSEGSILEAAISDVVRDTYLYYLTGIFILFLIIIGGKQGVKSVITLTLTGIGILKILLPLTLKGYSPILLSILICLGVIVITLIIISGISRKTLSAIIGTSGGVLVAGIITLIIGSLAKLTGLANEEAQMLRYIPQAIDFDFKGILFAGIILGALGAVMDVSMSIASSMNEINIANPTIKSKELFKAGMNVGRDIMGTMSNTLILAYAGGFIHLMLLFLAYDIPFIYIINTDQVASEVVRALAGSIGLIFAIPITALVASTISREKTLNI